MDYLSKGVKRVLSVVAAVLLVLALPVFGADAWWSILKGWGVPASWPVASIVWLLALGFGWLVGWVFHWLRFRKFPRPSEREAL